MQRKDYTVTKHAGPKVAGVARSVGEPVTLTEAEASAELLAGAIVPKDKAETDPLAGSQRLPNIQARAKGLDRVTDEPAEPPSQSLPREDPPKTAGAPKAAAKGAQA